VTVSGLTNAVAIAAGGVYGDPYNSPGHTCALRSDGSARCWGYNGNGQLGNGTITNSSTPATVSTLSNAVAIAAGGAHTCAVLSDGSGRCWGDNTWGQLGNGTTTNSSTPATVSTLSNAVAIAAAGSHTCALLSDGTARCWGWNGDGELGDGTGTGRLSPVVVTLDADSDGVFDGSENCLVVYNPGQENADNQIGNGKGIPGEDSTVPNSAGDLEGDACETDGDADNDGLPDGSDPDPGGDITYDDDGDGLACIPTGGGDATDTGPSWDSNCNGVLDGVEASCPLAVNPNGDDDADGLLNTWEVCKWGTDPTKVDTDGDTKGDCIEAVDTDGNGLVDYGGDAINSARATLLPAGIGPGKFGKDGDFDLNGNNQLSGDFGTDTITTAKMAFKILPCK
jgi:hypothetical protein